jgi:hypothetical protein
VCRPGRPSLLVSETETLRFHPSRCPVGSLQKWLRLDGSERASAGANAVWAKIAGYVNRLVGSNDAAGYRCRTDYFMPTLSGGNGSAVIGTSKHAGEWRGWRKMI